MSSLQGLGTMGPVIETSLLEFKVSSDTKPDHCLPYSSLHTRLPLHHVPFSTGNGMEDTLFDHAHIWNKATETTPAQDSSSKSRRTHSPFGSDQDSDGVHLPHRPLPSSSSKASAKKRKKRSSRPPMDVAAVSDAGPAAASAPHQSLSESSDEELANEVFEDPPLPPLTDLSPLDEDLAISSSDEKEALPVADRCSPTHREAPGATERSPQQEEASYPNLLSHPPPLPEQGLALSSLYDILGAPPLLPPGPSSPPNVQPEGNDHITPSVDNVTIQSVLYRPPGTQAVTYREEGGETLGSFILEREHYGSVVFLDDRLASFRIPVQRLIRFMGPILRRCSFTPFSRESMELKPFEHCVILKQALNAIGSKGRKLSVIHDRDMTVFKSAEDFQSREVARKSAEKVFSSFKGDYSKLPPPSKTKEKTKVTVQASGSFAEYIDISKMHKEDNIQAVVSTPRARLVLEEKEAREQLRRAVEFHEMFQLSK